MNRNIKNFFKPFIPKSVWNSLKNRQETKQLNDWKNAGCPVPPPHIVKQLAIRDFQKKYQYPIFIETGTYYGDMVEAQKKWFKQVYSIELGQTLFEMATKRFKKDAHVTIVQGDSGKVLHSIVESINEPAIFWLDGHYSAGITAKGDKECPIFEELDAILGNKTAEHVILIDDARCFIDKGDYPSIDQLKKYISSKNEKYQVEVEHDIIRCFI